MRQKELQEATDPSQPTITMCTHEFIHHHLEIQTFIE